MAEQNPLKLFITYLEQNKNKSFTSSQWNKILDQHLSQSEDRYQWTRLVEQHDHRAKDLRNRDRFEDAADEWERSLILNPVNRKNRFQLALLYQAIYENVSLNKKDRERALYHLERIKREDPDFKGIKSLEKNLIRLSTVIEPKEKQNKGVFVVFLPLLLAFVLVLFVQRDDLWDKMMSWFSFGQNDQSSFEVISESPLYGPRSISPYGFQDAGFNLKSIEAQVEQRNGREALSLEGKLQHKHSDIENLEITLRLLNDKNEVLESRTLGFAQDNLEKLRKGETYTLESYHYLSSPATDVDSLSLTLKNWTPSDTTLDEDSPIDILWSSPRPDGVRIEGTLRSITVLEAYDRLFYKIELMVENRGRKNIEDLRLELQGYSNGFSPFTREMIQPVNNLGPVWEPQEKKPLVLMFSVNHSDMEPLNQIVLNVIEIQSSP